MTPCATKLNNRLAYGILPYQGYKNANASNPPSLSISVVPLRKNMLFRPPVLFQKEISIYCKYTGDLKISNTKFLVMTFI